MLSTGINIIRHRYRTSIGPSRQPWDCPMYFIRVKLQVSYTARIISLTALLCIYTHYWCSNSYVYISCSNTGLCTFISCSNVYTPKNNEWGSEEVLRWNIIVKSGNSMLNMLVSTLLTALQLFMHVLRCHRKIHKFSLSLSSLIRIIIT